MRPSFVANRSLLDVGAHLRMARYQDEIAPHVVRLSQPVAASTAALDPETAEEERFLRQHDERLRATCRYLAELFPEASRNAVEDAWARAGALETLMTRVAKKEYGYPSSIDDDPPDPKLACPGFSDDVYQQMLGEALFHLR